MGENTTAAAAEMVMTIEMAASFVESVMIEFVDSV